MALWTDTHTTKATINVTYVVEYDGKVFEDDIDIYDAIAHENIESVDVKVKSGLKESVKDRIKTMVIRSRKVSV